MKENPHQIYFIRHAEINNNIFDAYSSLEEMNKEYKVDFKNWEDAVQNIHKEYSDLTIQKKVYFNS
jgi:hypothetical protein